MRYYSLGFVLACSLVASATAQDLRFSIFEEHASASEAAPLSFSMFDSTPAFDVAPLEFALFLDGQAAPKPRSKQLLFFGAEWCVKCKPVDDNTFPELKKAGWKIGSDEAAQIRTVDFDEHEGFAKEYAIEGLPTWVMLEHGKEVERRVGYLDPFAVGRLYKGENRQSVAYR